MKNKGVCWVTLLFILLLAVPCVANEVDLGLSCYSACLMEASTGRIIYEKDIDTSVEPASVTKTMTLLCICEEIASGTVGLGDMVVCSEYASSMGGSQIWLEEGEQMTVDDMLKAMVVVSANDCTVAMAEHIAGSEEAFVGIMNKRAKELGMNGTSFVNATGLPAENHYTTAHDIAIMTRELLKHKLIFNYTGIWMDTLRDGKMGLTNTNKLVRFYPGANGMKTGFTDNAGYCISATAKRDGLQLIAVVMRSPTSDDRFSDAKKLLDYGFANYSVYNSELPNPAPIKVTGGKTGTVGLEYERQGVLVAKGREKLVETVLELPEKIPAPVKKGDVVGHIIYCLEGKQLAKIQVTAQSDVERADFFHVISAIIGKIMSFA